MRLPFVFTSFADFLAKISFHEDHDSESPDGSSPHSWLPPFPFRRICPFFKGAWLQKMKLSGKLASHSIV